MELDSFIEQSLKQIIDGVISSQKYAKSKGAKITAKNLTYHGTTGGGGRVVFSHAGTKEIIHHVEFDIAVTAKDGDQQKGGFGIYVGPIGVGAQGTNENENTSSSRLKFSIPLILP